MSTTGWQEGKRQEVFEETLRSLERRRLTEPGFGPEQARGVLAHLYISQGNDWVGRGELQDLVLESTIEAYERFIERRSAESAPSESRAEEPPCP